MEKSLTKEEWRGAFIAQLVHRGIAPVLAESTFESTDWDYSEDPVYSADEELSYWEWE